MREGRAVSHTEEHRIPGSTPGFIVQAGGGDDAEMSQDSSRSNINHKYTQAGALGAFTGDVRQ